MGSAYGGSGFRRVARVPAISAGAALAVMLAASAAPATAQDGADARVRKLEAEVRALQRKVFPGGDQATFNPEITRPAATTPTLGQPATSPVTDLLARMDAVEAQMTRLTAQIEQNGNRVSQLEARAAVVTASPDAALPAPYAGAPSAGLSSGNAPPVGGLPPAPDAAPAANLRAMRQGAPTAGAPSRQRLAEVEAVAKPQSGDSGEDAYSYGFKLWTAKLYPEAEQQLKLFVEQYPQHARISYGRNLLGRAYLDAGDPREAAKWFLQNYQADKAAPRAADSLLYLAVAMKQLGDGSRACIAVGEFARSYTTEAATRLKNDYDSTRKGLTCT